mmetsp:Transcript_54916/g.66133  ORF Transcript_54916/g.66133 Transcript_54916/m.66133 type:complete len:95 (+) Transcript_54916:591-875(+)
MAEPGDTAAIQGDAAGVNAQYRPTHRLSSARESLSRQIPKLKQRKDIRKIVHQRVAILFLVRRNQYQPVLFRERQRQGGLLLQSIACALFVTSI